MMDRNAEVATARDMFNAATLGGTTALGRDDLGRIAPGAKADFLMFDGETLNMAPLRDPVKNLVYYAEMEDLKTVIIDGKTVVDARQILAADEVEITRRLQAAGEHMWPQMSESNWDGRPVDTLSPLTFPRWTNP